MRTVAPVGRVACSRTSAWARRAYAARGTASWPRGSGVVGARSACTAYSVVRTSGTMTELMTVAGGSALVRAQHWQPAPQSGGHSSDEPSSLPQSAIRHGAARASAPTVGVNAPAKSSSASAYGDRKAREG